MGMFNKMQKAVAANKSTDAAAVRISDAPRAVDPRWDGVLKAERQVVSIPIGKIAPDPGQHRKTIRPESIAEMAASLKARGQQTAILVYWDEAAKLYRIIFGERRYRGAVEAQFELLDCQVLEFTPSRGQVSAWQVVENEQREDLAPMERARSYAETMEANGWTQSQFLKETGLGQSNVSKYMALLDLEPDVQGYVERGELSKSQAYELRRLKGKTQVEVAELAAVAKWSAKQIEEAVKRRLDGFTGPLVGQAPLPIAPDDPPAQADPVAEAPANETDAPYSAGMESAPAKAVLVRKTGDPDWDQAGSFVLTLPSGDAATVAYDGSRHFEFRGPFNESRYFSHYFDRSWVREGESTRLYAGRALSEAIEEWARQAKQAERIARKIEKAKEQGTPHPADVNRPADDGDEAIAGWTGPEDWGARVYFDFDPDGFDEGAGLTLRAEADADWPRVVAILSHALAAAQWRAELAAVEGGPARPGDLVRLTNPADRLADFEGKILPDVGPALKVGFAGMPGGAGAEIRTGPGNLFRLVGAGKGGGS